jgi:hypothetical protein
MLESDKPYNVAASSISDNPACELGMTKSNDVSVYNHGFQPPPSEPD